MKAVLFDLYGTLLDIRTDEDSPDTWSRFAAWMGSHGMPAEAEVLRREFIFGQRLMSALPSPFAYPEPDLLKVFTVMCTARKPDASPELILESAKAFRRASTRLLQPYRETVPTLRYLHEQGLKLILVSNAQRCFTWQELELTCLLSHLDRVFISSDAGCKKPDPAFFRLAMEHEGLRPEDCIMVGNDGTSDIAGAHSAGLEAVYLRTAISPEEPLPKCRWVFPDGDIGHVRELFP